MKIMRNILMMALTICCSSLKALTPLENAQKYAAQREQLKIMAPNQRSILQKGLNPSTPAPQNGLPTDLKSLVELYDKLCDTLNDTRYAYKDLSLIPDEGKVTELKRIKQSFLDIEQALLAIQNSEIYKKNQKSFEIIGLKLSDAQYWLPLVSKDIPSYEQRFANQKKEDEVTKQQALQRQKDEEIRRAQKEREDEEKIRRQQELQKQKDEDARKQSILQQQQQQPVKPDLTQRERSLQRLRDKVDTANQNLNYAKKRKSEDYDDYVEKKRKIDNDKREDLKLNRELRNGRSDEIQREIQIRKNQDISNIEQKRKYWVDRPEQEVLDEISSFNELKKNYTLRILQLNRQPQEKNEAEAKFKEEQKTHDKKLNELYEEINQGPEKLKEYRKNLEDETNRIQKEKMEELKKSTAENNENRENLAAEELKKLEVEYNSQLEKHKQNIAQAERELAEAEQALAEKERE